jgi:hypothetical protein
MNFVLVEHNSEVTGERLFTEVQVGRDLLAVCAITMLKFNTT